MFIKPESVIDHLQITHGMHVADLGAGSGHFSIQAGKRVGLAGKIYVVDVLKDLLDRVKKDAEKQKLLNLEIVWGNIEKKGGTKLSDLSMDREIIANVLFQVEDKNGLASEAHRILRNGGKVLVIDWSDSFNNMGPIAPSVVSKESARAIFEKAGFIFEKEVPAGSHHYGFIIMKR